ncbi:MAG: hypothetical protein O7D32_03745 [bacterium]|nr:hypothetical protein [bacterium]
MLRRIACLRRLWAAVLTIVVLVGCAQSGDTLSPIERLRAEAEKSPNSINPWLRLGEAHLQIARATNDLHQTSLAESAIVHALGIDSTRFEGLMQLSQIKTLQHRFRDVTRTQHKAIVQNLRSSDAWAILGDAFMALGKYRAADSCYHIMWELDAEFEARVRIANRELWFGEREKAINEQQIAVQDGTNSGVSSRRLADAHAKLAEIFLLYGEAAPARAHIEDALLLDDAHLYALELRSRMSAYDGDWKGAIKTAEVLTRLSNHPRYELVLARAYRGANDRARERDHVERAQVGFEKLMSDFPEATVRERIAMYLEWGLGNEEALKMAYQESRSRRDAGAYELLAWAYYANGKYDMAWSSISLALRKDVRHPRTIHRAAVIAKAARKTDRFEKYATWARELNPDIEKLFGPLEREANDKP